MSDPNPKRIHPEKCSHPSSSWYTSRATPADDDHLAQDAAVYCRDCGLRMPDGAVITQAVVTVAVAAKADMLPTLADAVLLRSGTAEPAPPVLQCPPPRTPR